MRRQTKWEAFVDELLGDFFEVYVGVGWDVLVFMGDCWLLLCGCGKMGGHLGCYFHGDGRTCGLQLVSDLVGVVAVMFVRWVKNLPCTFQ